MNGQEWNRTIDTRIFSPESVFVSTCEQTTYNCKLKTYEAGRDDTETAQRAKEAHLVQFLVQKAHVIPLNKEQRIAVPLVFVANFRAKG
jgi:hypothetical protein